METEESRAPSEALVRLATERDVAALSDLATRTYRAAFGHTLAPEDLADHLQRHLTPACFISMLARDVVIVAELAGRLVGYVQFGTLHTDTPPPSPEHQELRRLYVDVDCQNRGLGGRLMAAALAHPRLARAESISLDVWEHNHGAQRFYARHGFEVVGSRRFEVASGAETSLDLVMRRLQGARVRHR